MKAGELGEARKRFARSLEMSEKLGGGEPGECSGAAGRVSEFGPAGGGVGGGGELREARQRFQRSLEMREKLAAANPGSAEAQRDVSVSLNKLGDVLVKAGELGEARPAVLRSRWRLMRSWRRRILGVRRRSGTCR